VSSQSYKDTHTSSRSSGAESSTLNHAAYDRATRQLSVCLGVLSAVLTALVARSVIDGPKLTTVLAEALIAVLLLASGALWRYVRRLEAHASALGPATPAARREKRVVVADLHESSGPQ
jgi:hypothetical protein